MRSGQAMPIAYFISTCQELKADLTPFPIVRAWKSSERLSVEARDPRQGLWSSETNH
jgi:hypothetical protein